MPFRCLECNAYLEDESRLRAHHCPPPIPVHPARVKALKEKLASAVKMLRDTCPYLPAAWKERCMAEIKVQADAMSTDDLVQSGAPVERLKVPNTTETEREYVRRALYDLAHIIEELGSERWDDYDERAAVLRGLNTHCEVLYRIANHVEEIGEFSGR